MKDTVCIYSGGMDSFTLAAWLDHRNDLHSCLSFNYGQRHVKELLCAQNVCKEGGIPHHIIDLSSLAPHLTAGGSALMGGDTPMPEGHYAEDSMKLTVVPNRNMIMLSVAIAYAVSHKLATVAYGAHAGDHEIYPDCRPEFREAMDRIALIANWRPIHVTAPFITLNKAGILSIGINLGLDYGKTWTCYKGGIIACGVCGSCQERLDAFAEMGKQDPLEYASRELIARSKAVEA